jgi:predicted type IV restriction endonuclease
MAQVTVRDGEEMWETITDGRVWVTVTDHRGHESSKSVGGKAGSRLRISTVDREINQDRIITDGGDPFANGMLRRVDADQNLDERTASPHALTNENLMLIFSKSAVKKLNETNVRRMAAMTTDVDASTSQVAFLETYVRENYRKEGDTPTYREMMTTPAE